MSDNDEKKPGDSESPASGITDQDSAAASESQDLFTLIVRKHTAKDLLTGLTDALNAGPAENASVTIKRQTAIELLDALVINLGVSEQAGDSYTLSD
jgi:hypothetical protein